jgi:hypothetical protein
MWLDIKTNYNDYHTGSFPNVSWKWDNEYHWWNIYNTHDNRVAIMYGTIYGPHENGHYTLNIDEIQ